MKSGERRQAGTELRRRLWFLRERLKDVTHDQTLTVIDRREKTACYPGPLAEARARLMDLEGH